MQREERDLIRELSGSGVYDSMASKFFDPPLRDGVLTYNISGLVPTGKKSSTTGRQILTGNFALSVSVTPSYDVDLALKSGSTCVFVGINYEPSEDAILEYEEDRKRHEKHEKEMKELNRKEFGRNELISSYCLYEKKETKLKNVTPFKSESGLPIIAGTCASCGRRIHKIGRIQQVRRSS